ncbi:exopolysaccharide biosynthesis protein [Falsihalocynthiibacter sp. BN13B15]|uniref:exopolysaccharide biosynthesis protein n=1 Tax=Falsihalocynthiibacter sp. BN13B15 TaxID=3240871 RepID=UPI00350FEF81
MEDAPPSEAQKTGFAALIQELDKQSQSIGYVTLGETIDRASTRMHGVAIFLMALPECIPLPIPSFGAILGVPLIAVSAHLAIYGERGDLPASARNIKIPHEVIAVMSRYMIRPLRSVERVSRNRLSVLGRRERIIGALCLFMSLVLLLPIPLINVPPAVALACLSWGLVQRDGLFISLGIVFSAGVVLILFSIADLFASLFT